MAGVRIKFAMNLNVLPSGSDRCVAPKPFLLQLGRIQEMSFMAVDLTPQLEAMIREKVQSGKYPDANEVVREASTLLEDRDHHARLRAAVVIGEEQYAAGRVRSWTPDRLDELKREADEEDRQGVPISDDVRP